MSVGLMSWLQLRFDYDTTIRLRRIARARHSQFNHFDKADRYNTVTGDDITVQCAWSGGVSE